jgi:RNA polymerase sporulation-specific sigma factor
MNLWRDKMIEKILNKFFKNDDVFFIGSTDILPPPLKKDIEEDLVRKSNMGDLNARNKLIEHNLRLVVFLAKKYDTTMYDLEDLVSIGTIGLIKGIKTYKLDKNIKLATYASRCIDNEILMFLRKNKRRTKEVSFEDSINFDSEGNELKIEDVFGTEEDIVHKSIECQEDKTTLEEEIKNLDDRDREIIEFRYGLGGHKELTQKELADKLSISQSYISRIEKKVIKKLKNLMKI